MPMDYGYVRVSTREQKTDRQMDSLIQYGLDSKKIFIDKLSGKNFNRPQYRKLIQQLAPGDTVFVCSIDRLGRNYEDILEQWRVITKDKEVNIVVLDMPLLDTRKKGKDLTGTFVADLVLQILSYVAQTERENIRKRQAEGIAAAQARGVHFGRSAMPIPEEFLNVVTIWRKGEIRDYEAIKILGVSRSWFYRKVKAMKL